MFVTKRFINRLKNYLVSIDLELTNSLTKNDLKERTHELLPLASNATDVNRLAVDFRYFSARFRRIMKVLNEPHYKIYQDTTASDLIKFTSENESIGSIVITNFIERRFRHYQLFYSEPRRVISIKPSKSYFSLSEYAIYKVKNTIFGFDVYQNNELRYSYKYSSKKNNVTFSTKGTLLIEKMDDTYYIKDSTRFDDQTLGSFTIKTHLSPGFSFSKVYTNEQEELVTIIALGANLSINAKEIQKNAAA